MLRELALCLGALLLPLLTACAGKPAERKVVMGTRRIQQAIVRNFLAGSRRYFAVFLEDRPLVLPAAFNDQRDVEQFIAAGGFPVASMSGTGATSRSWWRSRTSRRAKGKNCG